MSLSVEGALYYEKDNALNTPLLVTIGPNSGGDIVIMMSGAYTIGATSCVSIKRPRLLSRQQVPPTSAAAPIATESATAASNRHYSINLMCNVRTLSVCTIYRHMPTYTNTVNIHERRHGPSKRKTTSPLPPVQPAQRQPLRSTYSFGGSFLVLLLVAPTPVCVLDTAQLQAWGSRVGTILSGRLHRGVCLLLFMKT